MDRRALTAYHRDVGEATISSQDAAALAAQLRKSAAETRAGDATFAVAVEAAAARIEELVDADDVSALASAVSEEWRRLGEFALTRDILAKGPSRAFSAARVGDAPTTEPPLEHTPEAVFFLQRLVRDITRSV